MNNSLITIGITSYNARDSLERAINSALAQSWRPIEIVIVDDCSTDGTFEMIREFEEKTPELRVFQNSQNVGVAITRNKIIKEAHGEFIAFFDDDDESLPKRLELQYERISQYEDKFGADMIICHTAREVVYPHGEIRVEQTMATTYGKLSPSGLNVARRILLGIPAEGTIGSCATCSQMARKKVYLTLNGFNPDLRRGEDTEFNIRLALSGGTFVGISKPLVVQVMTKTSEKSLEEEYRNLCLIIEKHKSFLLEYGQYNFTKKWLKLKNYWLENQFLKFINGLFLLFFRYPILTIKRIIYAAPSVSVNRAFSRFHSRNKAKRV